MRAGRIYQLCTASLLLSCTGCGVSASVDQDLTYCAVRASSSSLISKPRLRALTSENSNYSDYIVWKTKIEGILQLFFFEISKELKANDDTNDIERTECDRVRCMRHIFATRNAQ